MLDDTRRPTPDELLAQIELQERREQRGQLKVFLGYASGVGKSFRMLDEGRRRKERGEDVVACALQSGYPPDIELILRQLEIIPTLQIGDSEIIDMPTVLSRRPQVAMIDGLAYDNPPGSANAHRWQDVEQLLQSGISVLTTVNIQYLENLQNDVERITGKCATCIIPRSFLEKSADEITVVDAPSADSSDRGVRTGASSLAEKHKLSRLRELALLVAASVVDRQLEGYLRSHGTEQTWGVLERILVCLTPQSDAAAMLESGRRNADRFQGEFYVVYLREDMASREGRKVVELSVEHARKLGADVHALPGSDPVEAILNFSQERGITQIFIGRGFAAFGAWGQFRGDLAVRLIRSAEGIDVVVYPQQ